MTLKFAVPSLAPALLGLAALVVCALPLSAWGGGVDGDCCYEPTWTPAECFLDTALTQPVACGTECYEQGGLILPIVCVPNASGTCDQCDCDDLDASVSPELPEACSDGKDNDCDGLVDGSDPDCGGGGIYTPAEVTATAENSFSGTYAPGNTIDVDCDNQWLNSMDDPEDALPTWLQYEFPATHTLSKVMVEHSDYDPTYHYLIEDYEVQFSTDPDCGTGLGFSTVATNTGPPPPGGLGATQETVIDPPAPARCVRINALSSHMTGLYQGIYDMSQWVGLSSFQAIEDETGERLIGHPCAGAPTPFCGNNVQDPGEECDGTDDDACPGDCGVNCVCGGPPPTDCGNNVTEVGEECDGTDDAACPGLCRFDCTCGGACDDFVSPTATVAIHVSETTKAYWGSLGGPHSAWQHWHIYGFLMEQLRSDGTPFDVVSDSQIEAGVLMNGSAPRFAILFSLANDCISDAAAARIEAFVSGGGHAFVGSTSWTRDETCALRGGGGGGGAIYAPAQVTATAENSFDGTHVPGNTIDLDCSNQWINAIDDPLPTWLQYEFPATHTLSEVVLKHATYGLTLPPWRYTIRDYEVQVSTDLDCGTGVGFSTVATNTGNDVLGEIQATAIDPPAAAKCVRVNALSSYETNPYAGHDTTQWVSLNSFQAIENGTGDRLIDHSCVVQGSLPNEFALSTEMGLTAGSPTTIGDIRRTGAADPLVSHLYDDTVVRGWKLALSSGADCYSHPSHWAQEVAASTATVLATTSSGAPILAVKDHGAGRFIYNSEFNPLAGYSMHTIANFVYGFYRKAIDEAHAATGLPNVRLGTWPYPNVAGFATRHDHLSQLGFDGIQGNSDDPLAAEIEAAHGVHGVHVIYAGGDLPNSGQACTDPSFGYTCNTAVQNTMLYMVSLGAEFGPHFPGVGTLDRLQAFLGFRPTVHVASGACGVRDAYKQALVNLGIVTKGDVAFGAHPHFALRIDTASEYSDAARFPLLDMPATSYYASSGGFAGNIWAHSITSNPPACNSDGPGPARPCMQKAVDLQYELGGLINLYDHIGDLGLANPNPTQYDEYIVYSQSKPNVYTTSALDLHQWWWRRDPVRVSTSYVTIPAPRATVDLACADDAGPFSVEVDLPFSGSLTVRVNGAATSNYELVGNRIRVQAPAPSQVEIFGGCLEDTDCNDGDPCNGVETCNTQTEQCEPGTPAPLSTPCEADADLCTNDHCDGNGDCVNVDSVSCADPTGECDGGEVCNPTTGLCEEESDPGLGTPCEADGNPCTVDICNGLGSCWNAGTVQCADPTDECDGGEVCNPSSGACDPLPDAPLSTPCNEDGDLCTIDQCDGSGNCVNLDTVTCPGPTGDCDGGQACNPSTGLCEEAADSPLSTPCEADADLCTNDHCDGQGSCVNLDSVTCPGQTGQCEAGEECNPTTGLCEQVPDAPLSTQCEADGDLCTNDHCDGAGNCVNLDSVSCPGPTGDCDGGESCNPATGLCEEAADPPPSTPCEADADLCTNEHCDGNGSCVLESTVSCPGPTGDCDGGQACNPTTGLCDEAADSALGTPCDADADLCTNDQCDGNGSCVFESNEVCSDNNVCTTESCNPATGCEYDTDPDCMEAPLPGLRLVIKDPPEAFRRRIVFVAKDPQVALGASGSSSDPRCDAVGGGGASLEVSSAVSGQSVSIPLPCANWLAIGPAASPGYKYLDKDLSEGPCKVVLIRAGKMVKARCLGRGPHGLDYDLQPGFGQAPVRVRLTTGSSAHYCSELGGLIRRDGADGKTFLAKGAPAPSGCEE